MGLCPKPKSSGPRQPRKIEDHALQGIWSTCNLNEMCYGQVCLSDGDKWYIYKFILMLVLRAVGKWKKV